MINKNFLNYNFILNILLNNLQKDYLKIYFELLYFLIWWRKRLIFNNFKIFYKKFFYYYHIYIAYKNINKKFNINILKDIYLYNDISNNFYKNYYFVNFWKFLN